MEQTLGSRLKHAWNAFRNKEPTYTIPPGESSYIYRPYGPRLSRGNERSMINSIINRIALDVSQVDICHCKLDDNKRFKEEVRSGLNNCLTLEANLDQTGRDFIFDTAMSMMDEGVVAMVPIETSINPMHENTFDIHSMRTAKILEWKPEHVRTQIYNERTGKKVEMWLPKKSVGIVPNPFYSVMNEPNSTMQRLMRTLTLLDVTDEKTASGKLDMIIQLPYVVKTDTQMDRANKRLQSIEDQLSKSAHGIAYTDGTEKIVQLNRPLENNLLKQIEYLTNLLFSQLGMTQSILDGTADEKTMLNYQNRLVAVIVTAITDELKRKFLSKTARTQGQSICAFRDPFRLVPVNDIAEIADKFTRNEIMTSNEIRQVIGMKPSADPKADELRNSNIAQS